MNRLPPIQTSETIERQQLSRRRRLGLIVLIVAIIAVLIGEHYFAGADDDQKGVQPIPIVVAVAHSANVPVYLSALGAVTPTYNVIVRTQINGQLLKVLFREGQTVKAGELLAEIDPRPYQAQLLQYQGQLARDTALLTNAQLDLQRYKKLWKEDSVAKQTLDTQASLVSQYQGTVKIDQGLIASTQVNLAYCEIKSPINGRVGLRLVDPGNFVQTSDVNGLVVVNMLNPITVIFTLPEDNVPQVMEQINTGKTLQVLAYDRTQNTVLATGTLLTIDNQIDPTTGTIKLKAQFQNNDNRLFPSQFVNVQLLVKTLQNATTVPTAAIQNGEKGTFVYLLNKNKTVTIKPVVVGVTVNNDTVVSSGVVPGQSVVVDGADKLTDGAKISLPGATPIAVGKHHHKK